MWLKAGKWFVKLSNTMSQKWMQLMEYVNMGTPISVLLRRWVVRTPRRRCGWERFFIITASFAYQTQIDLEITRCASDEINLFCCSKWKRTGIGLIWSTEGWGIYDVLILMQNTRNSSALVVLFSHNVLLYHQLHQQFTRFIHPYSPRWFPGGGAIMWLLVTQCQFPEKDR